MDEIRYGVIGTGMMGIEHMQNVALCEGARVVAVSDPHEPSLGWARLTAKQQGLEIATFADHRDLLARGDVDAVVVASPNHTHAAVLDAVFESGVHALVEKPLCTTLDDAVAVAERAAAHAGVFQVGMEYRYMPPVARLLDEVRGGTIGRLRMLAIREHRMPFLPKVGDWNRFARNTGGTLVEKCCHFFDLMRLIVGAEPARVFASGAQDVNHLDERYGGETPDILDNAFAIVDFEGGARALLDLCMFAEGSRHVEEIAATGDAGKVECFLPASTVVVGRRAPRAVEEHAIPVAPELLAAGFHHGSTYYEHLAFQRSIREGLPPDVSARDGLLAVAIGIAAERSAAEGRPVAMAELGLPAGL
ncbi:MAG: Gfo/Idh/MocA family oxidoreductase [Myxococcales bacterium]|nr:Gfo/Idh/MocA family oxidoreductase [Myxococcales bacterium]